MKIAKNINDEVYTDKISIVTKYKLVGDDYDFILNNMEDVTTLNNLKYFYVVGKMNHGLYRDSLKKHILPNFENLDYFDKEILINERIFPETYTREDIINLIGDEQYDYVERTVSETEQIEDILIKFNQYPAYIENNNEIDIRDTNYSTVLTLNTSENCVDAKYRISWGFHILNNKITGISYYRVLIDDIIIHETDINFEAASKYKVISSFIIQNLESGQHTIKIEVKTSSKTTTKIKNIQLEFWKLFD